MLSVKPTRDLLRRPPIDNKMLPDNLPQPRTGIHPTRTAPSCRVRCPIMGTERPIRFTATVAFDLAPHRRTVLPDPVTNHRIRLVTVNPDTDLLTILQRQLAFPRFGCTHSHPAMLAYQHLNSANTDTGNSHSVTHILFSYTH